MIMAGPIMEEDNYQMKQSPPATAMSRRQRGKAHESVSERKYHEDEAQMAYFGKKQQLEVSGVVPSRSAEWKNILILFLASCPCSSAERTGFLRYSKIFAEKFWSDIYCRTHLYFNDYMGGTHHVSQNSQ